MSKERKDQEVKEKGDVRRLSSLYFDSYGEFNPIQYLVDAFDTLSVRAVKIHCDSMLSTTGLYELVKSLGFKPLVTVRYTMHQTTKYDYLIHEAGDCIIDLSTIKPYETSDFWDSKIGVFHVEKHDSKALVELLVKEYERPKVKPKKVTEISFLTQSQGTWSLLERELKPVKLDVDNDYNLSYPIAKVQELLKKDKSGLLLFTGSPGTGKSYMIKWLAQHSARKFIFCPVSLVPTLSAPSFLSFAISNFKDSVLIIEDAETALVDRQLKNDSLVATLLNLTDGIFGDIIELKIIATINREEHVDQALLRKGRLMAKVDFKALDNATAIKNILTRLKYDDNRHVLVEGLSMTLADIYSLGENNGSEVMKRRVGFHA